MANKDSRITDLENDFAIATKLNSEKQDEIIRLTCDLIKVSNERDQHKFELCELKRQFELFLQMMESQRKLQAKGYVSLWESYQSYADKAETVIDEVSEKIEKHRKGPKKKHDDAEENWSLAREYFKEEIPICKTLKAARANAARRAGIRSLERHLIKMLPNPNKKPKPPTESD